MKNPIVEREFVGLLRTRKALAMQVCVALAFAALVVIRWPTDGLVDLSGEQSREVFQLFAYGLMATIVLLGPTFPASSIVSEKTRGTLALLLNSPMSAWSIFWGKWLGVLGFVLLLLVVSLPGAAACYTMGGVDLVRDIGGLYGVLLVVGLQYTALGLAVSCYANSTDSALRITYGIVLLASVLLLAPHYFFQGQPGIVSWLAEWARCISPVSAIMELLGHGDVGGLIAKKGVLPRFIGLGLLSTAGLVLTTVSRLNYSIFDRSRSAGNITDDRGLAMRTARRVFFLVDPQRRKRAIAWYTNAVMVKEFRSRRFGRSHWLLRLIAGCAVISLGLACISTVGVRNWGVEMIGGLMVTLQVLLIIILTPSLCASLISAERESGGWTLLQMTPLSPGAILRGKLYSAIATLLMALAATLPGYLAMVYIEPAMYEQVRQVLVCLALTAFFSISLSTLVSSFFDKTAVATTTAYVLLAGFCTGTLLIWLGRDAPFGQSTVQAALMLNPMAAALSVIGAPGFTQYDLVPANWWIVGAASMMMLAVLRYRVWRLTLPQ